MEHQIFFLGQKKFFPNISKKIVFMFWKVKQLGCFQNPECWIWCITSFLTIIRSLFAAVVHGRNISPMEEGPSSQPGRTELQKVIELWVDHNKVNGWYLVVFI